MNSTITIAPALPDVDVEEAAAIGDDILLGSARDAKVARVSGGQRTAMQSHQARAWTMGGQVD